MASQNRLVSHVSYIGEFVHLFSHVPFVHSGGRADPTVEGFDHRPVVVKVFEEQQFVRGWILQEINKRIIQKL